MDFRKQISSQKVIHSRPNYFLSKGGIWIRWKEFIPQCSKRRNRGGGGRGRRTSFRWGNPAKVLIFTRMITIFGSELEWLISNIIFQISVITPAKREHLLVGTCLLENIISRKHKKDIDEDRKKFRHQWVDFSQSEQLRFTNLKHYIFRLYTEQNKFIDFY